MRGSLLPPDLRQRLWAALGFGLWFGAVYYGCDRFAASFEHRFSVHIAWDDRVPFVPAFAAAYLLINALLLLPVLVLRETAAFSALCLTLAVEVAVAGLVFLIYPVEPPAMPGTQGSIWLALADAVNLTYNCFPSLHVALAVSVGMAVGPTIGRWAGTALWATVLLVCVSTVLTRQHFLADVLAGLALASAAMRLLYPGLTLRFRDAAGRRRPYPAGSQGYGSCSSDPRRRR